MPDRGKLILLLSSGNTDEIKVILLPLNCPQSSNIPLISDILLTLCGDKLYIQYY